MLRIIVLAGLVILSFSCKPREESELAAGRKQTPDGAAVDVGSKVAEAHATAIAQNEPRYVVEKAIEAIEAISQGSRFDKNNANSSFYREMFELIDKHLPKLSAADRTELTGQYHLATAEAAAVEEYFGSEGVMKHLTKISGGNPSQAMSLMVQATSASLIREILVRRAVRVDGSYLTLVPVEEIMKTVAKMSDAKGLEIGKLTRNLSTTVNNIDPTLVFDEKGQLTQEIPLDQIGRSVKKLGEMRKPTFGRYVARRLEVLRFKGQSFP